MAFYMRVIPSYENLIPPITVWVENGQIVRFSINREGLVYTNNEIKELLNAADVRYVGILVPLPDFLRKVPMEKIRYALRPGTYTPTNINGVLHFPESAFTYSVV